MPTLRASRRETTGHLVSRLTNDLTFIQQAAQISLVAFVRDALSVIADACRPCSSLDWMLTLVVLRRSTRSPSAGQQHRHGGCARVARRTQTELGDMTSRLTEKFSGPA